MSSVKKSLFKIILIGDPCVGKTALANRISKEVFTSHYKATSGFDMFTADIQFEDRLITLSIIDTAGLERYMALTNNFYRGANAVALCFDVTSQTSFDSLDRWKNEFLSAANPRDKDNYPFFLVATKVDLSNRKIDENRALRWSALNGKVPYYETSAKDDMGVKELFEAIATELVKREPATKDDISAIPSMVNIQSSLSEKQSYCC